MAKKFLDSGDIVTQSSGCVAETWPLRVRSKYFFHYVTGKLELRKYPASPALDSGNFASGE